MSNDPKERRSDYLLLGGVVEKLDTIDKRTERMEIKVNKHGEDLAALNVRTGIVGFLSGSVSTIILYLKLSMAKGGH
jgi:hypothetical protein